MSDLPSKPDRLIRELLNVIFNKLEPQYWFSVLQVCRWWSNVGTQLFKYNFLSKMLSNKWEGKCALETNNLLPLDASDISSQNMEAIFRFSPDNQITGDGKNHGYRDSWKVIGSYDPSSSIATWEKHFYAGEFHGRVVRYTGQVKLVRTVTSRVVATITGEIRVMKKQSHTTSSDVVGDTGTFSITSCDYQLKVNGDLWDVGDESNPQQIVQTGGES